MLSITYQPASSRAAAAVPIPFGGQGGSASFSIQGRPSPPGDPGPHGDIGYVSPDYFAALKIPLKRGRVFTDQDRSNTARVALIDETLAREYWPDQDPVGQHLRNGGSKVPWATIVGVVAHTKNSDLAGDVVKGKYYYPMLQQSFPFPFTTFVARSETDPLRLAGALREAIGAVDPTLAVSRISLLSDMVSASLAPRRFVVTLLGIFAGLALLLAVIGLYGVISYSVTQRTQEIGIRMALGAQPGGVLSLVIGQGMQLAGIGAAFGLAASLAISRLLKNQLFQVSAFDPSTFVAMALVLIAAALLATYIPARRATRVDPMEALRYE